VDFICYSKIRFFYGVLGTRFGSLESEKIGSLESEKLGLYRSIPVSNIFLKKTGKMVFKYRKNILKYFNLEKHKMECTKNLRFRKVLTESWGLGKIG